MKTIFISVASLRDPEIYKTINDIFKKAKNPKRVFVGLHYQYATMSEKLEVENHFSKYKNVKLLLSYIKDTRGISRGRNGAKSLYGGEDYILQIDSHTKFEKKWDENLISIYGQAINFVGSEKVILSAYLNEYFYKTKRKRVVKRNTIPMWTYMTNDKLVHQVLPMWANSFDSMKGDFVPARKFSANFVFTLGKYQDSLTLDEEVVFWAEEYSKTLDLVSMGYAIVHPNKEVGLTHLYHNNINHHNGQRLGLEKYFASQNEINETYLKEKDYIIKKVNDSPIKKQYEDYAGIKFGKQMCKTKFYLPPSFFPLDKV